MTFLSKLKSPSGQGTLGLLVIVSITILVAYEALRFLTSNLHMAKHIEIKGEIEQIRRTLSDGLSCRQTLQPSGSLLSSCTTGNPVYFPLKRENGTEFPLSYDITGGRYELRASCSGGTKLFIEFRRSMGDLATLDPLTKRSYDWKDLYSGAPAPCEYLFNGDVVKCPSGEFAIGFDKTSNVPLCSALPAPQIAIGYASRSDRGRELTVEKGPSLAFQSVRNARSFFTPPDSRAPGALWPRPDGVRCNDAEGWQVVSCWGWVTGADLDVQYLDNGCVTNDFDQYAFAAINVVCMKF